MLSILIKGKFNLRTLELGPLAQHRRIIPFWNRHDKRIENLPLGSGRISTLHGLTGLNIFYSSQDMIVDIEPTKLVKVK